MPGQFFPRLFLLFCLLPALGMAQTLTVGLSSTDYPPYYFSGPNGIEGAAVRIAEDLAAELGYTLSYRRYPWKRVQSHLKSGEVDMVLVYFKTDDRSEDVVYTDLPHVSEKASLFVSQNLDIHFNGSLADLSAYPFFGVRGYFYGDEYQSMTGIRKEEVGDEAELVRRIANPNLHLIGVGNQPAIEYYARKQGLEGKLRFLSPAIFEGYNYFAFSRARADAVQVAKRFSAAFRTYMTTSKYRRILQAYGLQPPGILPLPR